MDLTTRVKEALNIMLRPPNLQLATLSKARAENRRLLGLDRAGQFKNPIFALLEQFASCDPKAIFEWVERYRTEPSQLSQISGEGGYSFSNDYFTSPDSEVAYQLKPVEPISKEFVRYFSLSLATRFAA
jgi:hypothetical protein